MSASDSNVMYICCVRRLPVRKDTCKIVAISLNMQEKVHPVIWSLDNLPFDCQKSLSVPRPIGRLWLPLHNVTD